MASEQGREPPDHGHERGREMDQRIGVLERDINVLSHNQKVLGESFHSLEREMKEGISSLKDGIGSALSRLDKHIVAEQAKKPMPYRDMVSMATSIGTLIIMLSGAIFFLVQSQIGASTQKTNAFVETMEKDGKIFVSLDRLDQRLRLLEQAVKWKVEVTHEDVKKVAATPLP